MVELAFSLNVGFLLLGIGIGAALTPGVMAYFVRSDGHLTFKWGRRWYTVRDRSRH